MITSFVTIYILALVVGYWKAPPDTKRWSKDFFIQSFYASCAVYALIVLTALLLG